VDCDGGVGQPGQLALGRDPIITATGGARQAQFGEGVLLDEPFVSGILEERAGVAGKRRVLLVLLTGWW